jgi:MFS transporter, DHA1 family, multidrug resistance protein
MMKINTISYSIPLFYHVFFAVVTFTYWFSMYIYVPVFATYLEHLGGSYTLIGLILGSYGIMQILLRFPIGIVSDKLQIRKPFLIIGLLTAVISCFGFALTDSLKFAFVSRLISGITASMWVAFTVLYASYFKKEEATKAMGNIQFVTVTAQLTSMGLSGYLVSQWGWKAPFWLGGIIGIIGLIMTFWIKDPASKKQKETIKTSDFHSVFKESVVLKAAFLSATAHAVLFITIFGFTPTHALNIGASKESLTALVFCFMLPHAAAPIITEQYLTTRFNKWHILFVGFLGTALFSAVIPFIQSLKLLYITQALNGFAQGMTIPLLMGMAIQSISYNKRATAMGLFQAFYALGIFLGPFMAGTFSQQTGFVTVFYLAGGLALVGMISSFLWSRKDKAYSLVNMNKKSG